MRSIIRLGSYVRFSNKFLRNTKINKSGTRASDSDAHKLIGKVIGFESELYVVLWTTGARTFEKKNNLRVVSPNKLMRVQNAQI